MAAAAVAAATETATAATRGQTREREVATQDGVNSVTNAAVAREELAAVAREELVVVVAEEWVISVAHRTMVGLAEVLDDETICHHHNSELTAGGIFRKRTVLTEKLPKQRQKNL